MYIDLIIVEEERSIVNIIIEEEMYEVLNLSSFLLNCVVELFVRESIDRDSDSGWVGPGWKLYYPIIVITHFYELHSFPSYKQSRIPPRIPLCIPLSSILPRFGKHFQI